MAAPVFVLAVLIISSMVIMEVRCYPSRSKKTMDAFNKADMPPQQPMPIYNRENMKNGLFQDPNELKNGWESAGKRQIKTSGFGFPFGKRQIKTSGFGFPFGKRQIKTSGFGFPFGKRGTTFWKNGGFGDAPKQDTDFGDAFASGIAGAIGNGLLAAFGKRQNV